MDVKYKNYYQNADKMNAFIERSIKIEDSTKIPGLAAFKNFFRKVGNYIFGDHNWYSYGKIRSVLKAYKIEDVNIKGIKPEELSLKLRSVYKKIKHVDNKKNIQSFDADFKAKFKKKTTSQSPSPISPVENPPQFAHPSVPVVASKKNSNQNVRKELESSSDEEDEEEEFGAKEEQWPPVGFIPFQPSRQELQTKAPEELESLSDEEEEEFGAKEERQPPVGLTPFQPFRQELQTRPPEPPAVNQVKPPATNFSLLDPSFQENQVEPLETSEIPDKEVELLADRAPPMTPPLQNQPDVHQMGSSSAIEEKSRFPVDFKPFVAPPPKLQVKQPEAPETPHAIQDLVESFTLIDSRDLPEVSAKLLFHLQADEFGKDSELEGLSMKDVLNYIVRYLEIRKQKGGKIAENEDELIRELGVALDVANEHFSPEIIQAKMDEAFQTGRPCLLPGGWVGSPQGHAIYYEIVPDEGGKTATFRIFNTGEGLQEHKTVYTGVKEKVAHTEWRNIERAQFFDPNFLQTLHEYQTYTVVQDGSGKETRYNYRDVYFGLKKLLKVKPENCIAEEITLSAKLMQPQRAGVCAYRSLMAFMKTKIETNELRRLKCDMRLQALLTFSEIQQTPAPENHWRLVKKSQKQLSRKVERLLRKRAVDVNYLGEANQLLTPVKDWIKAAKRKEQCIEPFQVSREVQPLDPANFVLPGVYRPGANSSVALASSATKNSHLLSNISLLEFRDTNEISKNLEIAISRMKRAEENCEFEALYYAVIDVITKLPLDTGIWEKPLKGKRATIMQLNELGNFLFRASFEKQNTSKRLPEDIYCMRKAAALQLFVAGCTQGKNPFYTDLSGVVKNDKTFLLFDERLVDDVFESSEKKIEQGSTRDHRVRQDSPFHDTVSFSKSQIDFLGADEKKCEWLDELIYSGLTRAEELALRKKLAVNLSSIELNRRIDRLCASEYLPEWIKTLRDLELRLQLFEKSTPKSINPKEDPSFKYFIEYSEPSEYDSILGRDWNLKIETPRYALRDLEHEVPPFFNKLFRSQTQERFNEELILGKTKIASEEKTLLANNQITPEDKEVLHLFLGSSTSLIETIEFFDRHPEKLNDPNFQLIFEAAIFRPKSIHSLTPKTSGIVFQFLKKHLDRTEAESNYQAMAFLLRQNRYFRHFSCYASFDLGGMAQLQAILKTPELDPAIKTLVYTELLAQLSDKKAGTLSSDEATALVAAACFVDQNLIPRKWSTPKLESDAKKALHLHSEQIAELFLGSAETSQKAIHQVYAAVTGSQESLQWERDIEAAEQGKPIFTTPQGDLFSPLEGHLYTSTKQVVLPQEVRESLDFKALFPNVTMATFIHPGHYQFVDENKNEITIRTDGVNCSIEKRIENEMHRYISNIEFEKRNTLSQIVSRFQSRFLINHYTHWQPVNSADSLRLLSADQTRVEYIVQKSNIRGLTVTRMKDFATLGIPDSRLGRIEDLSYIHEWYIEGELIEIELPRLNLSFRKNSDGNFESVKYPGYVLSKDQTLLSLGTNKTHLVLEDIEGNKMVLLPKLFLAKNTSGMDPLTSGLIYDRHLGSLDSTLIPCTSYTVQKNGALTPRSREAALYLALTYAMNQEYHKSAKLLRSAGGKLGVFSPDEMEILKELSVIETMRKDTSGEMSALAFFATYLLSLDPSNKDEKAKLNNFYLKYLQRYRNITALKLTKDEELHLLKNLITTNEPAFLTRLRELDPSYALQFESHQKASSTTTAHTAAASSNTIAAASNRGDSIKEVLEYDYNQYLKRIYFERKTATAGLLTRASEKIEKHFPSYVTIALEGSDNEKKWLSGASDLMVSSLEKKQRALGLLLKEILEKPKNFSFPPIFYSDDISLRENMRFIEWWKKTLSQVPHIRVEEESESLDKVNLSPDYFRLDHPQKDAAEATLFHFTARELGPLEEHLSIGEEFKVSEKSENVSEKIYSEIHAWLSQEEAEVSESESSLEKSEWQKQRIGLETYRNQPLKAHFEVASSRSVENIRTALQTIPSRGVNPIDSKKIGGVDALKSEEEWLDSLEKTILEMANRFPQEDAARALRRLGGQDKKIDFASILTSFALKDPSSLQRQNPHLSEQTLSELYSMTADYLLLSTLNAQRKRCLDICAKWEKAPIEERKTLEERLSESFFSKRAYDVNRHPEYLVFEHYANILMREDQVQKLEELINGATKNPIMQMIMGSGKSKVLLPLIGLLRADRQNLSLVLVPAPLFESVATDTQKILGTAFSKSLKTLYFDRNSTFTKKSLEEIKESLETMINSGECLIMTSKSVASFILKFIEHYHDLHRQGIYEDDRTALMREILNLFSKSSVPLLDEADTILDVLREVSFSLGEKKPPRPDECALVGIIFDILYGDPEIKALASLESDPTADPSAPPFTKKIYDEKIKHLLAEKLLDRLSTESLKDHVSEDQMRELLASIKEPERKHLLNYLCRNEEGIVEAQHYYNGLSEELKILFKTASDELSHLLRHTLSQVADENYGLDENVFASPYTAATTPSKGSSFDNPHVTMNYTFAIYFKNGIDQTIVKKIIADLYRKAIQEAQEKEILLTETEGGKKFKQLVGEVAVPFDIEKCSDVQMAHLLDHLNSSRDVKRHVIVDYILPYIEQFPKKISCNPMMIANFFQRKMGFTGTVNEVISESFTLMPEIGTDAKTIAYLWENLEAPVEKIRKESLEEMTTSLFAMESFDLFSDAGGYLKEGGNLSVARAFSQKCGQPVVFYNARNEQTILGVDEKIIPFSESSLKEHERITFLDQSHTTGADVPQKVNAKGVVTIGRNTTLRDLLQAVWRLRGLGKGQTVRYLIDDEVESIIREKLVLNNETPITFKEILKFVIKNQCDKEGGDFFKAFKQELWALPQHLLLEILLKEDISPQNRMAAFDALQDQWIKTEDDPKREGFGKAAVLRPKEEVLKEEADTCNAYLKSAKDKLFFTADLSDEQLSKIEPMVDRYLPKVNSKIVSPISNDTETVEVENETEVEVEVETQAQVVTEEDPRQITLRVEYLCENEKVKQALSRYGHKFDRDYKKFESAWINGEELPNGLKDFTIYDMACGMMDKRIFSGVGFHLKNEVAHYFYDLDISENVFQEERSQNYNVKQLKSIFGAYRTPLHCLRVDGDDVVALSLVEERFSNYNLYLGFTKGNQEVTPAAFEKIVKFKFLNGECSYNKKEMKVLKKWFTSGRNNPELLKQFFLNTILKYRPEVQASFPGSPLSKVFNHILAKKI